jgi:hypothetical protein
MAWVLGVFEAVLSFRCPSKKEKRKASIASATTGSWPTVAAPTTSPKARALLNLPKPDAIPDDPKSADAAEPPTLSRPCPCCGGRMLIIETFARGCEPRSRPAAAPLVIRIDTS